MNVRRVVKRATALVALAAAVVTPAIADAMPRMPVCVSVAPGVPASLITSALSEADAIWRAAGLTLELRTDVCNANDAPTPVHVHIDDQTKRSGPNGWAVGWIKFTAPHVPSPFIVVSRATVERMLERQCRFCVKRGAPRQELIARALGRALAHEIGHYLLRSRTHALRGLMRANHPAEYFFTDDRRAFTLRAGEARAAARQAERLASAMAQ